MDNISQVNPELPTTQNIVQNNTIDEIKNLCLNYKNIIIFIVIIIGIIYLAYKYKYLDFIFNKKQKKNKKNKDEDEEEEDNDENNAEKNTLDLEKNYYINDENNNLMKINLKEMISLHKYYLEQSQVHAQAQAQYREPVQAQYREPVQAQYREPELIQQKEQYYETPKKNIKIKHPKKKESSEESSSEDELSENELQTLKKELADLEKQNSNI